MRKRSVKIRTKACGLYGDNVYQQQASCYHGGDSPHFMVDTVFILVSVACYSQQLAPAAARFSASGDTGEIVSLLRQGQQHLRGMSHDQGSLAVAGQTFDNAQDALDILVGRQFYGPSTNHVPPTPGSRTSRVDLKAYVESQVYYIIFNSLCVAYDADVPAEQTLTRGRLLPYLYGHSSVLEHAFTGGLRGTPFPLFPSMEVLPTTAVADLLRQLDSVPVPNDEAERRKVQVKLEALRRRGRASVSSEFADLFGAPPSLALKDLKNLLRKSLGDSKLAIVQQFQ